MCGISYHYCQKDLYMYIVANQNQINHIFTKTATYYRVLASLIVHTSKIRGLCLMKCIIFFGKGFWIWIFLFKKLAKFEELEIFIKQ